MNKKMKIRDAAKKRNLQFFRHASGSRSSRIRILGEGDDPAGQAYLKETVDRFFFFAIIIPTGEN